MKKVLFLIICLTCISYNIFSDSTELKTEKWGRFAGDQCDSIDEMWTQYFSVISNSENIEIQKLPSIQKLASQINSISNLEDKKQFIKNYIYESTLKRVFS